jgi:hypothetical protein
LIFVEIAQSCLLHALHRQRLVAGDVLAEVAGVAGVLVVAVQSVGDAAKAAEALQTGDLGL